MNRKVKLKKDDIKSLHFVGIGGVSMSALAKLLKSRGYVITGVDDNASTVLDDLNALGIKSGTKSNVCLVKNADIVVYTTAANSHPDLVLAKKLNKPIFERAEFLGMLAAHFEHTIAISGTHGKTTVSAMLGNIFDLAKTNPTVHIGGESLNWHSNLRMGGSQYFITEACEYNRSFLHLRPHCVCITNVECDHMDTYRDHDDVVEAFERLIKQTKKFVVYCGDDFSPPKVKNKTFLSYGFEPSNYFSARNLHEKDGVFTFDCYKQDKFFLRAELKIAGKHNVLNALACIAICFAYHMPYLCIIEGIQNFAGVARRFCDLGEIGGVRHFADYAHHPTEIRALSETAKFLPHRGKIVTIFQPHTYSRTKSLLVDFANVLGESENLILLPTFAAREKPLAGGDSTDLFFALPRGMNALYCSNYQNLKFNLDVLLSAGDICLWVGAGDIYQIAQHYCQKSGEDKNIYQ